ncbi:DeoR/GlpR family DNA-binding transcription regulator [Actinomyces mediterranea]|uniref:DeoR/GlpR family DNA-binding transcription regulator n=1 Tax=Actinomyces mediterranea TaxID=1871028 RepID=UPI000970E1DD|nr:DeoR/GlpR family DNA-binding transcription regulator [Actinomyces mediterranea]
MGRNGLVGAERRKAILRMVTERGSASVADLCADLDVSPATIHRDLTVLSGGGLVERVHGGVLAPAGGADDPHVLNEKASRQDEKNRIASAALRFVSPEVHSVFLEASTTVAPLASLLRDRRDLVFLTNSPEIALELATSGTEVTLVGGQLRARTLATVGPDANRQISAARVDVAFIGVSAIDEEGLSSMNAIEAETKSMIIASARMRVALGDYTKLGKRALAHVAPTASINALVTDSRADVEAVELLRRGGLDVVIADAVSGAE